MIELVELLFDEWYGARHRRNEKLARIASIRSNKDEIKRFADSTLANSIAATDGAAEQWAAELTAASGSH